MLIINYTKFIAALLLTTVIFSVTPNCQSSRSTGRSQYVIKGRVTDNKTGCPLESAIVLILGTHMVSTTDDSGYYCIPKIPSGIYNLKVVYIGYAEGRKDSVYLSDSTTTNVDFALPSWCDTWGDTAKTDIKKGVVRLLLSGMVVGNYESPDGKNLTHKYGFEYLSSCTLYPDCAASYNEIVEKYLEERNGKGWYDRFKKEFDDLDTLYR